MSYLLYPFLFHIRLLLLDNNLFGMINTSNVNKRNNSVTGERKRRYFKGQPDGVMTLNFKLLFFATQRRFSLKWNELY